MTDSFYTSTLLDSVLTYLIRRQMQGRPTTVRQVAKRVGLGHQIIKALMEKNKVDFVLIPIDSSRKSWTQNTIEVAIRDLPDLIAERNNFKAEEVRQSYIDIFGEPEPLPTVTKVGKKKAPLAKARPDEVNPQTYDPYYLYRITTEEYQTLKNDLITLDELLAEARRKKYPLRAVRRATGGDRMKYRLASPVWRPYVYRNKRFYLRDVLQKLHECYRTYQHAETAEKKWRQRREQIGGKTEMRASTRRKLTKLLSEEEEKKLWSRDQ